MSKKINILHLIYSFDVGGAEKLILNMLKNQFLDEKVNNHFISITGEADEYLKKQILSLNIKSFFFPKGLYKSRFGLLSGLLKFIRENNIELIHIHEGSSEKWALLCKLFFPKLKIVHTVHDTKILPVFSPIRLFFTRTATDKVIAVSESVFEECRKLSLNNAVHINNGIDLTVFPEKKTQIGRNFDFLNIINVSRLTLPKKGQDVLIRALGECRKRGLLFNCRFVGGSYDYDKEAFNTLTKLVKENEIENEVAFLGNRPDVPELLSQANLFVLPSRYEGLPLVLLEAMAAGLPVLASNIVSIGSLIQDGKNGILFESENHLDLADKILNLYNNQEKMKQIAFEGYDFVQNFDITKMCQNYYNIYNVLCRN